jgi:zinc/manganese transport system substrate-binding protein
MDKKHAGRLLLTALAAALLFMPASRTDAGKISVVATISTYGSIARAIGGDRVSVTSFVKGNEDAHFVRPKLSFSEKLAKADLFIDTGLDLELWVPALEDTAGNKKIMSGGVGYVSASQGITLLEKVPVQDRKEGDMHIYGNPHIYNSPINFFQVARNICTGLKKVDPSGKSQYEANLKKFEQKLAEKLYGKELVDSLGIKTLNKLAAKGKLVEFLEGQDYQGKKLIDLLGGWHKQALPIRGKKVIAYHKNWAYFEKEFNFKVAGYVEPKPGIPPTAKHVKKVIERMKKENINVLLAASFYDTAKVLNIAKKVDAEAVIVDIATAGGKGTSNVFELYQTMFDKVVPALSGK